MPEDINRVSIFKNTGFRVQTSRNDRKVVVMPENINQVSICLFFTSFNMALSKITLRNLLIQTLRTISGDGAGRLFSMS
jgi:hypothetical protein